MRFRPLWILSVPTLLLAATAWGDERSPDRHQQGAVYWTASEIARAGGTLQAVDNALIAESVRNFDSVSEIHAPGAVRGTAGRTFGAMGRVGDWASIAGSYSGGDEVGMANHATNAWLSGIVTGVGVTVGVAVAGVAGVPLLVGGVAGALVGATVYGNTAKVGVDTVFDDMANAQISMQDRANRIRMARVWVAQADYLCLEAHHWLGQERAGLAETEAAAASAEWAEDLLATARLEYGAVDGVCSRLDESANPSTVANELAVQLGELDALVGQAEGYADETCRIKSQMSQTNQPDAARIWNNTGQYLDGRVALTAADARRKAQAIREQADLIRELDQLRSTAGQDARAAQASLGEATIQLRGAAQRIAPAAAVVQRSQRLLPDIQAAVEDCDRKRTKAVDLLAAYERHPSVQMIASQEVYSIDPPFAALAEVRSGLESGLASIETARGRVDQAGAQLESWRARLEQCAARAAPSETRAVQIETRLARIGEIETRSTQCAQEAEVLATGPGGWGVGETSDVNDDSGGWGHGSARDVVDTSHLVDAAVAAVERCHYTLAVGQIDEILVKQPTNAWALGNRPEVAAWVSKAGLSRVALEQAQQGLIAGDVQGAFSSLATARSNAPPCNRDQIDAVWQRVKEEANRQEAAARAQAEQERQTAERDRQAAEQARREKDRRNREAMVGLAGSLGDLLTTISKNRSGGVRPGPPTGGSGGGTRGGSGGSTSQAKTCSIIHETHGGDGHFLLEFPPNQPRAPVGYLVASVPARIASGRDNACTSPRSCLGHLVPYRRSGARILGEYRSRGAADAEARKRCPNPVFSQ